MILDFPDSVPGPWLGLLCAAIFGALLLLNVLGLPWFRWVRPTVNSPVRSWFLWLTRNVPQGVPADDLMKAPNDAVTRREVSLVLKAQAHGYAAAAARAKSIWGLGRHRAAIIAELDDHMREAERLLSTISVHNKVQDL